MTVEKTFRDRISDLVLQYGSKSELARSLGVSRTTIYNWLEREEAPSNLDSTLERSTGNKNAIKRREYYYKIEKPRERFKKRQKITGEGFEGGKGIIERPLSVFNFRDFGYSVDGEIEPLQLSKDKNYRITIDITIPDTLENFEIEREIHGSDLDHLESISWAWARQIKNVTGSSELSLTIIGIEEI